MVNESTSVEDAKVMLQVVKMTIQQALINKEKDIKVKDLEIPSVTENFQRYQKFIALLLEESVTVGVELCDGLSTVIDSFIKEENYKRPLSELKATFLTQYED